MIFIADIENKGWIYEPDINFDFSAIKINFGFRKDTQLPVYFNNLSFGYKITNNDLTIYEDSMPPEGIVYISTDQEIIHIFEIEKIKLGLEYYITVWAENDGERWEHIALFFVPIPEKPYESWIWNEEVDMWLPPIPYPDDDDNIYLWNEETVSWNQLY